MKKLSIIIVCMLLLFGITSLSSPATQADTQPVDPFSLSTVDFANQIIAGFNLANTMESLSIYGKPLPEKYTPRNLETGWGNPVTRQKTFDTYAAKGFNAVRIPVSWHLFIDDNDNYKVRDDWMARVKEIVDYAKNCDMYIILNMHHDDKRWLDLGAPDKVNANSYILDWNTTKQKYARVWEQISSYFKDYDEKLIFEANNEPTVGNDWWGEEKGFSRLNELYEVFVDTVRKTGGNNDRRYLMLPTYGAQWYEHQFSNLVIPNNDDHVIVDIHWYEGDSSKYEAIMKPMFDKLISKGQGVIFGECGTSANGSNAYKTSWAQSFIGTAKKYKIPCLIWDDGGNFQVLDRGCNDWVSEALVDEIILTAKTTDPYVPATRVTVQTKPGETTINPNNPTRATTTVSGMKNYTIPAAESRVEYVGSWLSPETGKKSGENGSIILISFSDNEYVEQFQTYNYLRNIDKLIKAGRAYKNAMIAINVSCNDFHTGDDTQKNCLMMLNWVDLGFNDTDSVKLTAGETTTLYYPIDYFIGTPTALWVQFNNYKNFGNGISNDAAFEISLPYIAYSAAAAGDCNTDNAINAKDLLLLRQHLALWDVTIDLAAADCNTDSSVNAKDVLRLKQYLADWDVILGKV